MMDVKTKASYSDTETKRERENRDIALQAALEGIVLLENDGAVPVSPGAVALYGAGASRTVKGGTGSGEVNERHSVSILEGLGKAGFTVTTMDWIDRYDALFSSEWAEYESMMRRRLRLFSVKRANESMKYQFRYPSGPAITDEDIGKSGTGTCVYVVSRQSGEGADLRIDSDDYSLSETERNNILRCTAEYTKTIVVINTGSPFDLSFLDEISGINALFYISQLGTHGGTAFARILSGEATPSGRLTDTWPMKYEDIPCSNEYSYLDGNPGEEYYREGIFVGYRYFDTFGVTPRYPFGYGLSYTDFSITCIDAAVSGTEVEVHVGIENRGLRYSGKEVVQLYVSPPRSSLVKEFQRLAAFGKSGLLKPGESEELVLNFDLSAAASYHEERACFILDPGDYILRLGISSRSAVPCLAVTLGGEVVISEHRHICTPSPEVEEITPPDLPGTEDLSALHRLPVKVSAFRKLTHTYDNEENVRNENVDSVIGKLSFRELVSLVVGTGMGPLMFGSNYFNVPGAVGSTTSKLTNKGIVNVALADGPAGLRLQKRSALTRKGTIRMIDAQMGLYNYFPGYIKRFLFGDEKRDTLLYQFTTAFPVATALAQTWNCALMEEIGRVIGSEMAEYGVTFWLAPGLNIHRNPLCGRNFEYYSEDPLVSGKMAAAAVRGCQSQPGCIATVKHFTANNQEDNRKRVSSEVNERALREIYLRGFEIAVREGGAKAMMTSYNRLNGVYTPNSYDLCTRAARNEWGFNGVIMTDWYSTEEGLAGNGLCIHAGNDLIMPGGKSYEKQLMKDFRKGLFTEEELRRSAARVLEPVLESRTSREYSPSEG